jgi:hypothetical protein
MPLPNFITKIFSGGASTIVDSVSGAIDKLTLSKEEKEQFKIELLKANNEHLEKMATIAQAELDSMVKEMESARNREIQIAVSDKAPLINKIISPVLALLILGSTFLFWYIIIFKDINKDKEILISGVVGSLTTISMGVVGYYFGSSIGSHNKQVQLNKLSNASIQR